MSAVQKVKNVIVGLLIILCGVFMIRDPDSGYSVAVLILTVSLVLYGLKQIIYYFTMAIRLVGGKMVLYKGIILLDLGLFTLMLSDMPRMYVVLYLLACHLFSGVVDVLRALEAKKLEAPSWKRNFTLGLINIIIAVACLFFMKSNRILMYVYGCGLIYSAIVRIVSAFRRTAIVYVQ